MFFYQQILKPGIEGAITPNFETCIIHVMCVVELVALNCPQFSLQASASLTPSIANKNNKRNNSSSRATVVERLSSASSTRWARAPPSPLQTPKQYWPSQHSQQLLLPLSYLATAPTHLLNREPQELLFFGRVHYFWSRFPWVWRGWLDVVCCSHSNPLTSFFSTNCHSSPHEVFLRPTDRRQHTPTPTCKSNLSSLFIFAKISNLSLKQPLMR